MENKESRSSKIVDRNGNKNSFSKYELRYSESSVWRLLDANANRAREGLRVVEDTARFVLAQPKASSALRLLRHRLDQLVLRNYGTLLQHRDVENDSGRQNPSTRH